MALPPVRDLFENAKTIKEKIKIMDMIQNHHDFEKNFILQINIAFDSPLNTDFKNIIFFANNGF